MSPANFDDSIWIVENHLREVRILKHVTQQQLAAYAETSQNTISQLENGQLPNIALALRLARALRSDINELYKLRLKD